MSRFLFTLIYLFLLLSSSLSYAVEGNGDQTKNDNISDIIDPPGSAALNILVSSLSSLKELKKQNKGTIENIETLIRLKLLPSLDISYSTQRALDNYYDDLTDSEKQLFETYIIESLINDYVGILGAYQDLDSINITVGKNILRKDNRANVPLIISFSDNSQPVEVALSMIKTNSWKIYDVTYSGVSLIKNYQAQFGSMIKRKGKDFLIGIITKKVLEIKK
jgi:phospholipid transport system substrate-binding protein